MISADPPHSVDMMTVNALRSAPVWFVVPTRAS